MSPRIRPTMQFSPRPSLISLALALAVPAASIPSQAAITRLAAPVPAPSKHADFGGTRASRDAVVVANGIVASGDNEGAPFIILDKVQARVFVFEPGGRLRASAPALLGLAGGDDTVPGIGDKKIADIKPEERTTPAGRFVAEFGQSSSRGEDVVWVDYDAAVSMHRVIKVPERLKAMATPSVKDNRMSFGCINLPDAFYEGQLRPAVDRWGLIVYVL